MKCLQCNVGEAIKHKTYGYLYCSQCQSRHKGYSKVPEPIEITTQSIKDQRKEYKDDIIQPWRDGHLSKEYLEKYGEKKRIVITKEDAKNARNVWTENSYYHED